MLSFRNLLLKTGWPIPKSIYNIHNPTGLTLLNRLRVGLSHLHQHKFNHNFRNRVNLSCPCSLEIQSPFNFFCTAIISQISKKRSLMKNCQLMKMLWINQIMELLNYFSNGNQKFKFQRNCSISKSSVRFIIKSQRFNRSMI